MEISEKIATLAEKQKYNERLLEEIKTRVGRLENNYAIINTLSGQVERLAVTIEKLNDRIETMENKDKEQIEIELKERKNRYTQMGFNIINFIMLAFVSFILVKLGLK